MAPARHELHDVVRRSARDAHDCLVEIEDCALGRVTRVGAGMAGMTAALKLLEAGFTVRVLEGSSSIGGQFGAVPGKTGFHDFAWHVFAEWCLNFWKLVDTIGLRRDVDFVSRPTTILLRPLVTTSTLPRAVRVATVGAPETFWNNAASGVAHWSDVMLYAYVQAMLLADEALEREEFLNRVTLNGYVRSLPYASGVAALLQNELLLRVWAIPSYLISARAYQTYLQLGAPFQRAGATLFVLRKDFEEGLWRPFLATLNRFPGFTLVPNARLTGIRLTEARDRVDEILVRHAGESAPRREKVDEVLPYFKRSEKFDGSPLTYAVEDLAYHGTTGPMHVRPVPDPTPFTAAFVDAARDLGHGGGVPHWDFNGRQQENGAGLFQ